MAQIERNFIMNLETFFNEHPSVAIAFSGGCDSSYLLYQASQYATDVHAYYMNTAFQPAFELEDAQRFCTQYHIPLTVLSLNVCQNPDVVRNDSLRCYYCKQEIFSNILAAAQKDGYTTLLDGTNASDNAADRPGMRALAELQVYSPLRLCNLTKTQIRQHSKELGLFTHDKPAYACLATRIPVNTPIEQADLERVEECEKILFSLNFTDFRVRIFHNAARIQLPSKQFSQAIEQYQTITSLFRPYFDTVLLDLVPRDN